METEQQEQQETEQHIEKTGGSGGGEQKAPNETANTQARCLGKELLKESSSLPKPQPQETQSPVPEIHLAASSVSGSGNPCAMGTAEIMWETEGGHLKASSTGKKALKILLIGHQFQVPSEGQAKADALAKFTDIEVCAITPQRYREGENTWRFPTTPLSDSYQFHVERVRLPWAGLAKWYLHWYPDLPKTLCAFQPDIIDVWEEPWSLLSAEVCWLRDRMIPNARIISETEQNIGRILPPPFEWFRSYTFGKADFLIGRNTQALSVARAKGYHGPSRVIGNGVDTNLFRPLDRAMCRRKLGISGFAVGYAGRLVSEKGLKDLVEAVSNMDSDVTLWVCGSGPLRDELQASGPKVHVSEGIPRARLPEYYNAIDVLVLPSHTTNRWKEQFGRVLIEAQACGTPVVGSDSGAIPEVIGNAGIIFSEGDIRELQTAIERIKGNEQLREDLSDAGREQVKRLYSWDSIAIQMREVYIDIQAAVA
ncbi:MAG: glycosyltransferase family 4 protein [Verrucomicrobiota bacterium]